MIRVLLVDDQALIRQAISVMLDATDDITIVGQGDTGLDAIAMAQRLQPDVVLMDIRMPELDGIAATEKICGDPDLAATRVLILTTFENDTNIVAALRAGASGFIGKGSEPEELARAVRAVANGDALLSPSATRSLITRMLQPTEADPEPYANPELIDALTIREREVLRLVTKGLSNQEIADELVISIHTTKTHVGNIMTKLGAHDRAQLVIVGYESGLVAPGGLKYPPPYTPVGVGVGAERSPSQAMLLINRLLIISYYDNEVSNRRRVSADGAATIPHRPGCG